MTRPDRYHEWIWPALVFFSAACCTVDRTEIREAFSQSVTWCFAQAQTQTLPFKNWTYGNQILPHTRSLSPQIHPVCAASAAFQQTSSISPAASPDYRSVGAAVRLIGQASAVYQRSLALQSLLRFSIYRVSAFGPRAHGIGAVGSRTAPVVCIRRDIFKQSPVKDIHRARG